MRLGNLGFTGGSAVSSLAEGASGTSWGDVFSNVLRTAGDVYTQVKATKVAAKQGIIPGQFQQPAPVVYDSGAYPAPAPSGFTLSPDMKRNLIIGAIGLGAILLLAPMAKKRR